MGCLVANHYKTKASCVLTISIWGSGYRFKTESKFDPHLEFSLGLEVISSAFSADEFSLTGFALEERMYYDLNEVTELLPVKAYFGLGQIFFESSHDFFFRTGLVFPIGSSSSIDIGALYLNDTSVNWGSDGNYSQSSNIGGLAAEIILSVKI